MRARHFGKVNAHYIPTAVWDINHSTLVGWKMEIKMYQSLERILQHKYDDKNESKGPCSIDGVPRPNKLWVQSEYSHGFSLVCMKITGSRAPKS
jgi:hypothetical protein